MLYKPKKIDYTSPAGSQGGPGVSKQITHYVGTPYIDMSAETWKGVGAAIGATLGDMWWLGGGSPQNGGNAFMFVKANAGLTLGQLVALSDPTTGTTTTSATLTTLYSVLTNISNATAGVNGEVDNWIFVASAAATLPQLRRIKANDASATGTFYVSLYDNMRPNTPHDKDAFDNVPLTTEAISIIRPFNVKVNTATTVPVGVALGTVTSGNYTIIQVAGMAAVLADGDTVDLVVNQPAVGKASGLMTGSAAAAANLYLGAGIMLPQVGKTTSAATAPLHVPTYINFLGQ